MPYETDKPIFATLLMSCLLPGKTTFEDSKATVRVEPKKGETILFFNIDEQSNSRCKLRQLLWGEEPGQGICDLIVFYAQEQERIICFVELKDNLADLGKVVEQLINTYDEFKQHLKLRYTAKAYVYAYRGSSHRKHQDYEKKLAKKFPKGFKIATKNDNDMGDFLRDVKPQTKTGKNQRKGRR